MTGWNHRDTRSAAAALLAVLLSLAVPRTLSAQAPRDTARWTTQTREFRESRCRARECATVDLAWPRFSARNALNGRVQGLLLASLLNGDGAQKKYASTAALSKAFLDAARSDSATGLTWNTARAITVLCNTPERVVLQLTEDSYTGGAHGNFSVRYRALEPLTGAVTPPREMLPLDRAVEVVQAVERAFRREREIPATSTLTDAGFEFPNGNFTIDDATFAVCGSSLFVHWNAYAIAPYASGPTTLVVPLDSVPALRR